MASEYRNGRSHLSTRGRANKPAVAPHGASVGRPAARREPSGCQYTRDHEEDGRRLWHELGRHDVAPGALGTLHWT